LSVPLKEPTGVRAALTITTSRMRTPSQLVERA
jgi:hypothetical protein